MTNAGIIITMGVIPKRKLEFAHWKKSLINSDYYRRQLLLSLDLKNYLRLVKLSKITWYVHEILIACWEKLISFCINYKPFLFHFQFRMLWIFRLSTFLFWYIRIFLFEFEFRNFNPFTYKSVHIFGISVEIISFSCMWNRAFLNITKKLERLSLYLSYIWCIRSDNRRLEHTLVYIHVHIYTY